MKPEPCGCDIQETCRDLHNLNASLVKVEQKMQICIALLVSVISCIVGFSLLDEDAVAAVDASLAVTSTTKC